MSGTAETKQRAARSVDAPLTTEPSVADRTEPTDVAWSNAAELRAITPEEVQLLAATGC